MIQSRTFYVICQANKYIILEPVLRPIAAGWTKDTNKQENIYILGSVHTVTDRARYSGHVAELG